MNPQMQNYRQYAAAQAQAQNRSPATARRPVMNPNQLAQQQAQVAQRALEQQIAQQNAARDHQQALRRARKPTDRNLPDGLDEIVGQELVGQYKRLQEAEKKLDYTMTRKRLELQDRFSQHVKREKTMRFTITNTVENQLWQRPDLMEAETFDFNSIGPDATARVCIHGKLLDEHDDDIFQSDDEEEGDDRPDSIVRASKPPAKRMSHFIKKVEIEYDMEKDHVIDPQLHAKWDKTPQSEDFDQLRFKRKIDTNLNITISLYREESPERYRLSNALADTLDMKEGDRAEVVMYLWEYVKFHGLQEDDERRTIRCDDNFKKIFGRDTLHFPLVADLVVAHLHPLDPIRLPYTIRVDEEFFKTPSATVYDVRVQVEDPLRARILAMTQNPRWQAQLREIARLDDQIAVIVQALHHHKAKHTFFMNFAKDPVGFMRRWNGSQAHDLAVILGEADKHDTAGLEFAKGGKDGVWGSEIVEEAVRYRLAKGDVQR